MPFYEYEWLIEDINEYRKKEEEERKKQEKEQKPFGILQTLIDSPEISDIIVTDFDDVCVQQKRKN